MDRGAWWATVYGDAKSRTLLKRPSMHACKLLLLEGRFKAQSYVRSLPSDSPRTQKIKESKQQRP